MPVATNEWQKEHPWESSLLSHPQPVPLVKPSDLFNPMLTIGEIMKPDAPMCSPDDSVAAAARILRDSASSAVSAVSEGRPLGILTDRRVALAVAEHDDNLGHLRVQDLMRHHPPTVPVEARLGKLLETFGDEGVAVVDANGRVCGVVRWLELLDHFSERALGHLVANLFSPRRGR